MKLTVREAARKRTPLDGTDAQALEHALTQVEKKLELLLEKYDTVLLARNRQVNHGRSCFCAECLHAELF